MENLQLTFVLAGLSAVRTKFNLIRAITTGSSLLLLASCAGKQVKETSRPNILFILTDDHTTQAISAYGSVLAQTPNIDRIANEGIRFDNCYATNALSGPSRACILTGKFNHENGFKDNACTFNGDQQTFPKILQDSGYQTAIIGKWHLISDPQGFDFWSILSGQHEQGDYYRPEFVENGDSITEEGYVTDVITAKSIAWLKNRNSGQPFALMLHHKAPHRDWMPAQRHLGIFNTTTFPEPENLFDDFDTRSDAPRRQDMSIAHTLTDYWDLKLATPEELASPDFPDKRYQAVYNRMTVAEKAHWNQAFAPRIAEFRSRKMTGDELVRWKYQQYLRDYLATAQAVDEGIGQVLDYLASTGELDNTLIVYASDQGFFLGEHGFFDKRFMYEECQRMPLVMRLPTTIKAGSVTSALSMNVDFAPTFLDLAGIPVPEDMQGESLLPILSGQGKTPAGWRDAVYYHYYEYPAEHSVKRHYGIRTERYKLIHFYNDIDAWEMYDLQTDPKEMHNLYGNKEYANVEQELKGILIKTRAKYRDN
jgi:arylsulfatase A-like enzyme